MSEDRKLINELEEGMAYLSDKRKLDEFFSKHEIKWPKAGDKVTFRGVNHFWYWSIIKAAKELLEMDKEYTVKKCEPFSSWVAVELEEFPGERFSLGFFNYEKAD